MNPSVEAEKEPFTFRVIDLKQYVYCPRVAYYHLVLPNVRPITYNMEHGLASHVQAEGRERRRSLGAYGLKEGERQFNVPLWSAELGLSGELDMLIETETERIPVDYKDSEKIGDHFKLQLMAYGRLLEETGGQTAKPIGRGFIYLIPLRKAMEVKFTPRLRRELADAQANIQAMATRQLMPGPTDRRGRCIDCEFRRFCNDVD
jgi:CRISPR-associated exonuclease Cas4